MRRPSHLVIGFAVAVLALAAGLPMFRLSPAGTSRPSPAAKPSLARAVDPVVTARLQVPAAGDVAVGAGAVWVRSWNLSGTLWKIDEATGRVLARLRVGTPGGAQRSIAFGFGAVWVLNSDGRLLRVDPNETRVTASVSTSGRSATLAVGEEGVWVTCCGPETVPGEGGLTRIDPETLSLSRIPLEGHPGSVAVGEGAVWAVNSEGSLWRVDPDRQEVTASVPLRSSSGRAVATGPIAAGEGAVWVADRKGYLLRVEPETNRTVARIRVSGALMGLTAGEGSVWINGGPLVGLDPRTNRVDSVTPVSPPMDANAGIAVGERTVWVANDSFNEVVRVDVLAGSSAEDESCSFPPYRPTYLPWLPSAQRVPEPTADRTGGGAAPDYATLLWKHGDVTHPGGPRFKGTVVLWRTTLAAEHLRADPRIRPLRGGIQSGRLSRAPDSPPGSGDWGIVWWDEWPSRFGDACAHTTLVVSLPNLSTEEVRRETLRIARSLVPASKSRSG